MSDTFISRPSRPAASKTYPMAVCKGCLIFTKCLIILALILSESGQDTSLLSALWTMVLSTIKTSWYCRRLVLKIVGEDLPDLGYCRCQLRCSKHFLLA